jgi:hypothetical protein
MPTYSFLDVGAALDGPGGNINLGQGAGVSDEGITVERVEDRNTMTTGADGSIMHSLHASSAGTARIRLLKTSPTNALLMAMHNYQTQSGARHGQNTIRINDFQRGDVVTCVEVAFTGAPALTWSKAGNMNEWTFHCGSVHSVLGFGVPVVEGVA